MADDFSELGLGYDSVRQSLFELGVIDSPDDTTYTEGELANLMFVANLTLDHSIGVKATEVEELLVDFQIQENKLDGFATLFASLRDNLSPDDDAADVSELMDFIETEYRFIDLEEASTVPIDYSFTYSSFEDPVTFDDVQEFLAAVSENPVLNDSGNTFLAAVYNDFKGDGDFDGIFRTDGVEIADNIFGISRVLSGDAYIKVTQPDSGNSDLDAGPDVYLDGDGFQDYVIAKMLQDEGFISSEVYVEPIAFASSSQPSLAGSMAANWIEWHQNYFGKLSIIADADADTLAVEYNGVAGLSEMGITLSDFFEDSSDDISFTLAATTIVLEVEDYFPDPFGSEKDNWLVWLTGIDAYGDLESLFFAPDFSDLSDSDRETLFSFFAVAIGWSTLTEAESLDLSTSDYLEDGELNRLQEQSASAVENEAALGEISLLEVNTAITEWSELHSSWDTIHKYTTDAAERAIAAMK